ncbi:flagellar export chaperone FlgN [Metabacillus halosaccharovorans]|uniref:flagellar export chaperone FlgN n=1 Tax=Metabacillus halosaccharovorans TaxID=930124 RepID=UPI00203A929A|nr:flagellar export chaperone FlgN [Metabacillus halosaccharovorans]MCM3443758.1 flagellar protein FlgN [Metabacillus halosaccharovorans]
MSAEDQLYISLEKIVKLQKSLYIIALKKRDSLKADDIEALRQIMKEELKHIKAIEVVNKEREMIQHQLATELLISKKKLTMSNLLESDRLNNKEKLRNIQVELLEQTQKLKEINELNQQLLQQSLNFVNLNLDMILGQQEFNNYSDRSSEEAEGNKRSLFDSQA